MASKACAYCYVIVPNDAQVCRTCRTRVFCSHRCRIIDWQTGHKRWCRQSGEIDYDYCIRPSPGKGLGVFTLRDFKAGEKIFVERPIIQGKHDIDALLQSINHIPASAQDAVFALEPSGHGASLREKILLNIIDITHADENNTVVGPTVVGLFIILSRVNHCCIGNCMPAYLREFGVTIMVANCDLSEGEEITFPYVPRREEHARIKELWKFDCGCMACSNSAVAEKLDLVSSLDKEIDYFIRPITRYRRDDIALQLWLARVDLREKVMSNSGELLRIYDELRMSPHLYQKTYYAMFKVEIMLPATSHLAPDLARRAAYYAELFYGADHEFVDRYKNLAKNPSSHPYYEVLRSELGEVRQQPFEI